MIQYFTVGDCAAALQGEATQVAVVELFACSIILPPFASTAFFVSACRVVLHNTESMYMYGNVCYHPLVYLATYVTINAILAASIGPLCATVTQVSHAVMVKGLGWPL